jgi:hypothetical protein
MCCPIFLGVRRAITTLLLPWTIIRRYQTARNLVFLACIINLNSLGYIYDEKGTQNILELARAQELQSQTETAGHRTNSRDCQGEWEEGW